MEGYRNIGIFVDEEKMKMFEKRIGKYSLTLEMFVEAFIDDMIEEPEYKYEKYLTGCARTYFKARTGEDW